MRSSNQCPVPGTALYDLIRSFLVCERAPGSETPRYLIRSNLVYWPLYPIPFT
jgi:hypothetical protein